jgi:hypothetical protein
MSVKLVSYNELQQYQGKITPDYNLMAFRLVKVGPQTLTDCNFNGAKICEIIDKQSQFFLIGSSSEELKQSMHELVDRFFSA